MFYSKPYNFIKTKLNNSFVGNVGVVLIATILAQLINFMALPYATDFFGVEGFGVYTLALSFSYIVLPFSTLKFELALFVTNKNEERKNINSLTFFISIVFSLMLTAIHFLVPGYLNKIFKEYSLPIELELYLPVLVLFLSIFQLLVSNLYARSEFKKASLIKVLEVVLFVILIFVFRENQFGLINSKTLSNAVIFLVFVYLFGKKLSFLNLKKTFIKYKEQPIYLCPAHVLNALSREIPMVMLTYFYGIELAALYALANRIIKAPIGLIGKAIGDVFRTRTMNLLGDNKRIDKIYNQTLIVLIVFAIIFLLLVFIGIETIIKMFFSEEWIDAIKIIKIISVIGAFQLISNPLGNLFIVTKNQRLDLVWQIILFVLICTALIVGGINFDFKTTLTLFTISYSLGYFINIIMSYRLSK